MRTAHSTKTQLTIDAAPASMKIAQDLSEWFFTRYGHPANPLDIRDIIFHGLENIAAEQRNDHVLARKKAAGKKLRLFVEEKGTNE